MSDVLLQILRPGASSPHVTTYSKHRTLLCKHLPPTLEEIVHALKIYSRLDVVPKPRPYTV